MTDVRLRSLGIQIGSYQTGPLNAITDVPGVLVGQMSLNFDDPFTARTGVTAIYPRADIHEDFVFAGYHSFNGIGEMTGLPFIQETGLLTTPILLTHTSQVGLAYDVLLRYGARKFGGFAYKLPVVAETFDGWLNGPDNFPLKEEHILNVIESATDGPVAEGNTGGGTGMICYEFKGGTGTASRQVVVEGQEYTVGALVQTNHGDRAHLRVDGAPVGREINYDIVPPPWPNPLKSSSILIIIATNAPLLPNQCERLAKRGTVGLARTGGYGLDTSGDLFLAFSTGIHNDPRSGGLKSAQYLPHFMMDPLVIGTAEAVEEAILNSLVAAETMTGYEGRTAHALPHDLLLEVMRRWYPGS